MFQGSNHQSLLILKLNIHLLLPFMQASQILDKLHLIIRQDFHNLRWFIRIHYKDLEHIKGFQCDISTGITEEHHDGDEVGSVGNVFDHDVVICSGE